MRRLRLVLLLLASACAATAEATRPDPVSPEAESRTRPAPIEPRPDPTAEQDWERSTPSPMPSHVAPEHGAASAPQRPTLEAAIAACTAENAAGCFWAGTLTVEAEVARLGANNEAARRPADRYFARACDLGAAEACDFAGLKVGFYCFDGTPPNTPTIEQPVDGWCSRSLNRCRAVQQGLSAEGWSIGECRLQKKAACYSYREALTELEVRACFPSFELCGVWSEQAESASKQGRDIVNFQPCQAVK